jgi:hypothetical protein
MVNSSYLAAENASSWVDWVISQQPGNLLRNLCFIVSQQNLLKTLFLLFGVEKLLQA